MPSRPAPRPLTAVLGFERALFAALLTTVTAPILGARAAHQARRGGEPLVWWGAALGLATAQLLPTWAVGWAFETLTTPCDPRGGTDFLFLLGGGNAVFGSAVGFVLSAGFIAAGVHRPLARALAAVLVIDALALAAALARLYREPQIDLFSQPFGWWPGSLYDEALAVPASLIAFRAVGVLASLAVVLAVRGFLGPGHRLQARVGPLLMAGVTVASPSMEPAGERRSASIATAKASSAP